MTKNEWIDKIVKEIYQSGESQLLYKGDDFNLALKELLLKSIIKVKSTGSYFFILDAEGYKFAESNLTYIEWIAKKEIIANNIIEIKDNSFVSSPFNVANNPATQSNVTTQESKKSKTPILQYVYWIIGIIIGSAAIYELYKRFVK